MAPTFQGEWIKVDQKGGETPGPRSAHGIAVVGNKLYCFGGELIANKHIDKDLYVFDFNTQTWSIAPANGEAPDVCCLGVRMVAVGTKIYIFGGRNEDNHFSDFYSYDTVKKEWKLLTKLDDVEAPNNEPAARTYHAMASDENHVYVFGGVSKGGRQTTPFRFKTAEAYNIATGKWAQLPDPPQSFEPRGGAGFVEVQGKIWVVYGFATSPFPGGKSNYESDAVHYFDPATEKWTEVKTTGAKPSARSVFAHAVVGKYIIIFGGEVWPDLDGHLKPGTLNNEGYVLDTETLVWEKFGEGDEPKMPRGWTAYTSATLYGKKGLLMHGGKLPTNERTDDIYFYAVNSA
uniref:Epithiospecifier protein n=1 Tax=Cardamine hirsuta TaxID=50463 RepID=J7FLJ0_CARHR|nr:epithiospecifier protein [Cardamine hirsuta]